MRQVFSKIALAAVIFSGIQMSASASTTNLNLISGTTPFANTTVTGDFVDFINFNIEPQAKLAAFLSSSVSFGSSLYAKVVNIEMYEGTFSSLAGISGSKISTDANTVVALDGASVHTTVASTANLDPLGYYTIVVSGTSFTPSAYVGLIALTDSIRVVPAVPEPETYAMLLAGLGMMSLIAKRRQKSI